MTFARVKRSHVTVDVILQVNHAVDLLLNIRMNVSCFLSVSEHGLNIF